MREVDVTAVLEVPRAAVEEKLSPESIVEYAGTYAVESVEETADGAVVTAAADELVIVLEFIELDNGYSYRQRDGTGPFAEMHTRITVTDTNTGTTRVSIHSEFTFGGLFAFLQDRLGAKHRQRELERLAMNLAGTFESPVPERAERTDANPSDRSEPATERDGEPSN